MSRNTKFRFRLYVAGDTVNSAQALSNLNAICRAHLPGRHAIEIVNVLRDPKRALTDKVFMTPTLVRLEPAPAHRIIGTLSQTATVLQTLGLVACAA